MLDVVADLEASCWKAAWARHRVETIEIGAVRLDDDLRVVDELDAFVRPVVVPRLSTFCRELTSIAQEQVDAAAGTKMEIDDSWIAATAIAHGWPVVTEDGLPTDSPELTVVRVCAAAPPAGGEGRGAAGRRAERPAAPGRHGITRSGATRRPRPATRT
ncbi:MAG TPA: exonuclease domain-containing protein [Acidimicrobiales bacterium]